VVCEIFDRAWLSIRYLVRRGAPSGHELRKNNSLPHLSTSSQRIVIAIAENVLKNSVTDWGEDRSQYRRL